MQYEETNDHSLLLFFNINSKPISKARLRHHKRNEIKLTFESS